MGGRRHPRHARRAGRRRAAMRVLLVTGDRDALQLVEDGRVEVVSTRKGITDIVVYDEAGVVEKTRRDAPTQIADYLGLKGDTSDNIPGVPGRGREDRGEAHRASTARSTRCSRTRTRSRASSARTCARNADEARASSSWRRSGATCRWSSISRRCAGASWTPEDVLRVFNDAVASRTLVDRVFATAPAEERQPAEDLAALPLEEAPRRALASRGRGCRGASRGCARCVATRAGRVARRGARRRRRRDAASPPRRACSRWRAARATVARPRRGGGRRPRASSRRARASPRADVKALLQPLCPPGEPVHACPHPLDAVDPARAVRLRRRRVPARVATAAATTSAAPACEEYLGRRLPDAGGARASARRRTRGGRASSQPVLRGAARGGRQRGVLRAHRDAARAGARAHGGRRRRASTRAVLADLAAEVARQIERAARGDLRAGGHASSTSTRPKQLGEVLFDKLQLPGGQAHEDRLVDRRVRARPRCAPSFPICARRSSSTAS